MLRQYDEFNGSGALGSYWSVQGGTWSQVGGFAEVQSALNVVSEIVHTGDAGLPLPMTFVIRTSFQMDVGIKFVGILALCDVAGTSSTRIEARWRDDFGQRIELIVPGFATMVVSAPNAIDYTQPQLMHFLELRCEYQSTVGGDPVFVFKVRLDGQLLLVSAPRALAYWDESLHKFCGLVGLRENFGSVPSPRLAFDGFGLDDLTVDEHDPAPSEVTEPTRTPVSVLDEKPIGSPVTFPYSIGVEEITPFASVRSWGNELGYKVTSARLTAVRWIVSCTWMGTESDKDGLLAFHEARVAGEENFRVTIPVGGIGTRDVFFLEDELDPQIIGPDLWRVRFSLAEAV